MKTPLAMEAGMYWLCAKAIRTGQLTATGLNSVSEAADEIEILGQHSDYEQIQDRCIEAVNSYAAQNTVLAKLAHA